MDLTYRHFSAQRSIVPRSPGGGTTLRDLPGGTLCAVLLVLLVLLVAVLDNGGTLSNSLVVLLGGP